MKRIFAALIFLGCMAFPIHAQTSGNTPPPPPYCTSANAGALYTNTGTSPATVYTCSYYNLAWQWVVNPSYGGLVYYPTVPSTCSGALPVFLAGWPNTQEYVCVNGVPDAIGDTESGVTNVSAPSGSWPSWLVPTVTNPTTTPSLAVAAGIVPTANGGTGATTAAGALANLGAMGWFTYAGSSTPSATCSAILNNGYIAINATPTAYQCSNATGSYAWNTLGGSSFNPASPGPIGGTTPSTGAFTNLTASGTVTAGTAVLNPAATITGLTVNSTDAPGLTLTNNHVTSTLQGAAEFVINATTIQCNSNGRVYGISSQAGDIYGNTGGHLIASTDTIFAPNPATAYNPTGLAPQAGIVGNVVQIGMGSQSSDANTVYNGSGYRVEVATGNWQGTATGGYGRIGSGYATTDGIAQYFSYAGAACVQATGISCVGQGMGFHAYLSGVLTDAQILVDQYGSIVLNPNDYGTGGSLHIVQLNGQLNMNPLSSAANTNSGAVVFSSFNSSGAQVVTPIYTVANGTLVLPNSVVAGLASSGAIYLAPTGTAANSPSNMLNFQATNGADATMLAQIGENSGGDLVLTTGGGNVDVPSLYVFPTAYSGTVNSGTSTWNSLLSGVYQTAHLYVDGATNSFNFDKAIVAPSYVVGVSAGVTSTTCTQYTGGICTHL